MFIIRLAGGHLYGKWLLTWLSLGMLLMVFYFLLSFFPRDDLRRSGTELSQFLTIVLPTLKFFYTAANKIIWLGLRRKFLTRE